MTACEEIFEECGYKVDPEKLGQLNDCIALLLNIILKIYFYYVLSVFTIIYLLQSLHTDL